MCYNKQKLISSEQRLYNLWTHAILSLLNESEICGISKKLKSEIQSSETKFLRIMYNNWIM